MVKITLYNTRTRSKERFEPLDPENVRMYVCGPTVYDRAHIGNARPVVVFDVLFRLLRHVYGPDHVTYVRNITDIDDKIIRRARESGRPIGEITAETTRWFHEDMAALGALRPTHEPRATEYIPQMIAMIETLIARGHAYAAEGHVLFAVASYPDYGKLARRSLDEMRAGARIEVAPYKRDPMDFVLWKPSGSEEPGWESPWGRGRPGWHIECSAMAEALLGPSFDIHGGGIDLAFPHHENEVAQSRCAHPEAEFARVWMHNGFLQVGGEKMAKSAGNFFTVKDLLDRGIPGEVIRFVLLSTHYRQPLDWTEAKVEEARTTLLRWAGLAEQYEAADEPDPDLLDALADDLNTPLAIKVLHDLAKEVESQKHPVGGSYQKAASVAGPFLASAQALGLLTLEMGEWRREPETSGEVASLIEALLEQRAQARRSGDFKRADAIRDGLRVAGVALSDRAGQSTEWWIERGLFDRTKLEALR